MSTFKISKNTASKTLMQSALIAAFTVAAFAPLSSMAQVKNDPGHLYDARGVVVKNSTGLCWRTSAWTPAMATAECEPELMAKAVTPAPKAAEQPAPAAAPAPAAPAPATKLQTRKITFSSEELFDFDKVVIRPEGKAKLDALVEELKTVEEDTIVVTGHADRIGNPKYNQKLSERRAASVNAYLVSKGILESRTTSKGMGETQPVTKPGECKGPRSKKLIACLQPDRRVEVDVSGSKQVTVGQ